MSDSAAPTAVESTHESLQALSQYFPGLMAAYQQQIAPTEQAKLSASQQVSPQYAALLNQLYQNYAPGLAKTGSDIEQQNRLAQAATDASILKGPGADLARTYSGIDKELNPEYYKTRAAASDKLGQLLSSIDLNKPDVEAERLIGQENARTGNLGNTSNTNTVGNALQFGQAKATRQNALSNAIGQATQFLQPSSNASFNPATTILNRPTSNTGLSQFGGVTPSGNEAFASGNNFLNTIGGFQNQASQINANRRDVLDRLNETTSSL